MQQTRRAFPVGAVSAAGDPKAAEAYKDSSENYYSDRLARLLDSTKDTKITWWGQSYQKAKENELSLGLDLQGGINVTLDVALDGLIKGISNNPKDPSLIKAI